VAEPIDRQAVAEVLGPALDQANEGDGPEQERVGSTVSAKTLKTSPTAEICPMNPSATSALDTEKT
jgi:hypothetical protein